MQRSPAGQGYGRAMIVLPTLRMNEEKAVAPRSPGVSEAQCSRLRVRGLGDFRMLQIKWRS